MECPHVAVSQDGQADGRVADKAIMKFNHHYLRKMNEEEKHTIKNHAFFFFAHLGSGSWSSTWCR